MYEFCRAGRMCVCVLGLCTCRVCACVSRGRALLARNVLLGLNILTFHDNGIATVPYIRSFSIGNNIGFVLHSYPRFFS